MPTLVLYYRYRYTDVQDPAANFDCIMGTAVLDRPRKYILQGFRVPVLGSYMYSQYVLVLLYRYSCTGTRTARTCMVHQGSLYPCFCTYFQSDLNLLTSAKQHLIISSTYFSRYYLQVTRRASEPPIRTCIVFLDNVQNLQIHAVRAKFYQLGAENAKQQLATAFLSVV